MTFDELERRLEEGARRLQPLPPEQPSFICQQARLMREVETVNRVLGCDPRFELGPPPLLSLYKGSDPVSKDHCWRLLVVACRQLDRAHAELLEAQELAAERDDELEEFAERLRIMSGARSP